MVVLLSLLILGGYWIITVVDRDVERDDVKGGYKFFTSSMFAHLIFLTHRFAIVDWGVPFGRLLNALILATVAKGKTIVLCNNTLVGQARELHAESVSAS